MPQKNRDPFPSFHQKMLDIGIIDNWLRGVARLVPLRISGGNAPLREPRDAAWRDSGRDPVGPDFNRHTLNYGAEEPITHTEIQDTRGFRRLIRTCARNNIRIDLTDHGGGRLDAHFYPDAPFLDSRILGMRHFSALPPFFKGER